MHAIRSSVGHSLEPRRQRRALPSRPVRRTAAALALWTSLASSACGAPSSAPGDATIDAPGHDAGLDAPTTPVDASTAAPDAASDAANDTAALLVDQVAPTPPSQWVNVTHNLAGMASECGNLPYLTSHPYQDMLITGVAQHGLWASTDGGESWHRLGTGAGSATITNRPSEIVFDPSNHHVFWESGIYNGGGGYQTTDDGLTFTQLGDSHHDDSIAVDFADPQRRTLLMGGHEQKQTLYRSTNGGATWTNVGAHLPMAANFCTEPVLLDAQTHLVGCSGWGGGTDGVFRTTDGGMSWSQVSAVAASGHPLVASDGAIYWPVIYDHGLLKSTDRGQSWTQVVDYGVLHTAQLLELPDHRLAAAGMGGIVLSSDGGHTWHLVSDPLPFTPTGIAYSVPRRALYAYHFDCTNNVPSDAIMRFGFDYSVR